MKKHFLLTLLFLSTLFSLQFGFAQLPVANFTAVSNHICPGTCTDFINLSTNATSYHWFFSGAPYPDTSSTVNPTTICYNWTGSYDVTLIATNSSGSDTLTIPNYMTVYPYPPPQNIILSYDTLIGNQGYASYQWYVNGYIINGATDYFYVITISANFNLVSADTNGCEVEAGYYFITGGLSQSTTVGDKIKIFPNPVSSKLAISSGQYAIETISIFNLFGKKVLAVSPLSLGRGAGGEVDVSALPSGMYIIEVSSSEKVFRSRFVKQ